MVKQILFSYDVTLSFASIPTTETIDFILEEIYVNKKLSNFIRNSLKFHFQKVFTFHYKTFPNNFYPRLIVGILHS